MCQIEPTTTMTKPSADHANTPTTTTLS